MTTIAVVDYGMGNLNSVAKALEHVSEGATVKVVTDAAGIAAADRIVFPGQGAIRDCMRHLDETGLRDAVVRAAASKPLFGVCVGMQMLFAHSEEGDTAGLGIFPGDVRRFDPAEMREAGGLKVPHMGWNRVAQRSAHPIWDGVADDDYFYFVHSYYVAPAEPALETGSTVHGHAFTSAVAQDNIFATQFHPEKSAASGLALYRNFVNWRP